MIIKVIVFPETVLSRPRPERVGSAFLFYIAEPPRAALSVHGYRLR